MRFSYTSPSSLIRNINAGDLLENFLISSVTTVLLIRFSLYLTGYPQLGGDSLHIAHMLWGGLLMFIAITIVLVFLNRPAYDFASVIGGIGFGTFIDELGKFITHDNNYFFQPTVAILYIIFILLYLFVRVIDSRKKFSEREYLVNAIEMIKEAVQNDMDKKEKQTALRYLNKCDPTDPFVKDLKDILNKTELVDKSPTTVFSVLKRKLHNIYLMLIQTRWFVKATLLVFGVNAVITLLRSFVYAYGLGSGRLSLFMDSAFPVLTFSDMAQIFSSSISALLVLFGAVIIFRDRLSGFQLLKYSILISIFFTQVFAFYNNQLQALAGLIGNIFLYLLIQYYITEEEALPHKDT